MADLIAVLVLSVLVRDLEVFVAMICLEVGCTGAGVEEVVLVKIGESVTVGEGEAAALVAVSAAEVVTGGGAGAALVVEIWVV